MEQTAESAMSGVGCVVEETRHVRDVAKTAIPKAKSVHGEIESRVALLTAQAEASTAQITGVLSERVQEVAAHSEVQASCIVDAVSQQLERGLEAVAASTVATSEQHT